MNKPESSQWAQDWPSNVTQAVQSLGYCDLTDFLQSMPAKPYSAVVATLKSRFAPAQIVSVQYREARQSGTVRNAAKDALCRHIVKRLPEGWSQKENAEYERVSALVDWSTEMQVTGGCSELEGLLKTFRRSFTAPEGWIPTGPDDPVITEAFDKYWPEE